MRIAVLGATGFVGRRLLRVLVAKGHSLRVFSRDVRSATPRVPEGTEVLGLESLGPATLSGLDAVVNLAGEPVAARRWNTAHKARIRDSRVGLTRDLVLALEASPERPGVLVNASAVGFYGPRGDEEIDESEPCGGDFLATVCAAWEREASRAATLGVREVRLRIGLVLGPDEGALAQMVTPFRFFAGGALGQGRQYVPWVHVDDVVALCVWSLEHSQTQGAVNVCSPSPLRSRDFAKALGRVMQRPAWFDVPKFALKIFVGELADVLVTGQRAVPSLALAAGYDFAYDDAESALRAVLIGHKSPSKV